MEPGLTNKDLWKSDQPNVAVIVVVWCRQTAGPMHGLIQLALDRVPLTRVFWPDCPE